VVEPRQQRMTIFIKDTLYEPQQHAMLVINEIKISASL
jgi:hypothetical protein